MRAELDRAAAIVAGRQPRAAERGVGIEQGAFARDRVAMAGGAGLGERRDPGVAPAPEAAAVVRGGEGPPAVVGRSAVGGATTSREVVQPGRARAARRRGRDGGARAASSRLGRRAKACCLGRANSREAPGKVERGAMRKAVFLVGFGGDGRARGWGRAARRPRAL